MLLQSIRNACVDDNTFTCIIILSREKVKTLIAAVMFADGFGEKAIEITYYVPSRCVRPRSTDRGDLEHPNDFVPVSGRSTVRGAQFTRVPGSPAGPPPESAGWSANGLFTFRIHEILRVCVITIIASRASAIR